MKRIALIVSVFFILPAFLACTSAASVPVQTSTEKDKVTEQKQEQKQEKAVQEKAEKRAMAPDFTLNGFQADFSQDNGDISYTKLENVSLSDFRGKLVFLNFWATWCPSCRMEMLQMKRLHERYKDKGLVILAVEQGQIYGIEKVKEFVVDIEPPFPILLDAKMDAGRLYRVTGIPETFLIGPGGHIEKKIPGAGFKWYSKKGRDLIEKHLPSTNTDAIEEGGDRDE